MTDYQHLLNRMRELETKIDQLENSLKNEFAGELHCNKDRTRYRWRITTIQNDGTKTSETISQKDRLSAEKAAEVTIRRAELQDYQAEYKACLKYVSVCELPRLKEVGVSQSRWLFLRSLVLCFSLISQATLILAGVSTSPLQYRTFRSTTLLFFRICTAPG